MSVIDRHCNQISDEQFRGQKLIQMLKCFCCQYVLLCKYVICKLLYTLVHTSVIKKLNAREKLVFHIWKGVSQHFFCLLFLSGFQHTRKENKKKWPTHLPVFALTPLIKDSTIGVARYLRIGLKKRKFELNSIFADLFMPKKKKKKETRCQCRAADLRSAVSPLSGSCCLRENWAALPDGGRPSTPCLSTKPVC